MHRKIDKSKAQKLIRATICLALKNKDSGIHIDNNIKLIPKAVIVEAGRFLKYEVELYTIDESLLNATVKEITLSLQYKDKIAELTIVADEEAGHIYLIPSSIASEEFLNRILYSLESKADCI